MSKVYVESTAKYAGATAELRGGLVILSVDDGAEVAGNYFTLDQARNYATQLLKLVDTAQTVTSQSVPSQDDTTDTRVDAVIMLM